MVIDLLEWNSLGRATMVGWSQLTHCRRLRNAIRESFGRLGDLFANVVGGNQSYLVDKWAEVCDHNGRVTHGLDQIIEYVIFGGELWIHVSYNEHPPL